MSNDGSNNNNNKDYDPVVEIEIMLERSKFDQLVKIAQGQGLTVAQIVRHLVDEMLGGKRHVRPSFDTGNANRGERKFLH